MGSSPEPSARPSLKRLRVLIAEDDRDTAASLEALVQDEGHETRCAFRGREVVGAARDFAADVVLLDIGMPGINGYDIARVFRKLYGSRAPTLIAVTAWNKSADKLMAKHAGFDHHIAKPYDPIALLGLLDEIATRPA
jgi:CheY-like chemotaxis protein